MDAVIHTHDWACDVVREALARGHRTFWQHWQGGGHGRAERTRDWIDTHHEPMQAALSAGG